MRIKRCALYAALGLSFILLVWGLFPAAVREPCYAGKSLSEWLAQFDSVVNYPVNDDANLTAELINSDPKQVAIRNKYIESRNALEQIGTNAIPTLLRMLRTHDSF